MANHTPGPWHVDPHCPTPTRIDAEDPYGKGMMHIADVRGWGHLIGVGGCHLPTDEAAAIQDANAKLIASAPDMRSALEKILETLEDRYDGARDSTTLWMGPLIEAARKGLG